MKRLILSTLTVLLTLVAGAQDWRELRKQEFLENFPYKYEVRLGWSGYPILEASNYPNARGNRYIDPYFNYVSLEKFADTEFYGMISDYGEGTYGVRRRTKDISFIVATEGKSI